MWMKLKPGILPFLTLAAAFGLVIASSRTIAPLDFYRVYPFLYEKGNAASTHSSYLKDINDVYLPWKYYLSEYSPGSCVAEVKGASGSISMPGVDLPGGDCYPLDSVRSNLRSDIFFPLRNLLSFFVSYDLSYFLLLAAVLFSSAWFFGFLFPDRSWLLASAITASFPIARELQFDGLSQCWPYMFLSLGSAFAALRQERRSRAFAASLCSAAFLFLAIWRSTLQGLGMLPFFWGLTLLLYGPGRWRVRLCLALAILPIAMSFGLVWYWNSIQVFYLFQDRFLVENPVSWVYLRRAAAWIFSWGNFLFGELLTGFNTLDLSKSIRPLGARDHYSYDGASFFLQPVLGFFLFWNLFMEWKEKGLGSNPLRIFAVATLLDFLISVSPLYRLFYFRFHQWWALLSILMFFGMTGIEASRVRLSRYFWAFASVFLICQAAAIWGRAKSEFLLAQLGRQGVLGFEVGVWESRLDRWISRAHALEFYGVMFWLSAILVFLLLRGRYAQRFAPAALLAAGLVLNVFHFNKPHPTAVFSEVISALRDASPTTKFEPKDPEHPPTPHPQNLWLFVNKIANPVHESLAVPAKEPK